MTEATDTPISVLRIYHSGVVSSWRDRERFLIALGVRVRLVSPRRWNEGGAVAPLDADADDFVVGIGTVGTHPNLFLYEPWGLWRALRADRYDVIDIHEEPVSLAAAEVQLLAWIASRRAPFCLYSAQNIDKTLPAALPLDRAAGVAPGRRGAHLQRRSRAHPAAQGIPRPAPEPRARDRHRSLFAGSVPGADRVPARRLRRTARGAQGRRRPGRRSREDVGRTLVIVGDGPERASLGNARRRGRFEHPHLVPGVRPPSRAPRALPRLRRRGRAIARDPGLDRAVRPRRGGEPWPPVFPSWHPIRVRCPKWSATPACSFRPATRRRSGAALRRRSATTRRADPLGQIARARACAYSWASHRS